MTTLAAYAAFLTARWDELEQAARDAEHFDGPRTLTWERAGRRRLTFDNGRGESYEAVRCGDWDRILVARDEGAIASHVAMHDPAHILADLAAKRAILGHVMMQPPFLAHGETEARAPWFIVTLAEPFCGHPDHPANQEQP